MLPVRAHARRKVIWMLRSQRENGVPFSWAAWIAASISSPGRTPSSLPHPPLKRSKDQVGHQKETLPFPQYLADVQVLPRVALGQGGMAAVIQLHADPVRRLFFNHPADFIHAVPRDVRCSYQDDGAITQNESRLRLDSCSLFIAQAGYSFKAGGCTFYAGSLPGDYSRTRVSVASSIRRTKGSIISGGRSYR